MELQKLNNCCSTLYLHSFSDYYEGNIKDFKFFCDKEFRRLDIRNSNKVILYICSSRTKAKILKKLGFKKKCSYYGEQTSRKVYIYMLDLRKLTLKERIKKWVDTW